MIAAVHRRSALLAGAELVGVLGSSPQRSAEVAARLGVPNAYADLDELDPRAGRRGPRLQPQRDPRALRRGAGRGGQARRLREAAGGLAGRGRADDDAGRAGRGRGHRAVRLPLPPDRARDPGPRAGRRVRAVEPAARPLPAGLAAVGRGVQLARRSGAGRRLAGVRRHRLALVRPGRVGQRPEHRDGDRPRSRSPSRDARPTAATFDAADGARAGRHRGLGDGAVPHRRRRAGIRRRLAGRGRPQEPALVRARRRHGQRRLRPGEPGVVLVRHRTRAAAASCATRTAGRPSSAG